MHGIEKGLDPPVKPEKQRPTSSSSDVSAPAQRPRIGQGREGLRRKMRPAPPSQPRQIPAPTPEVAVQPQQASKHGSPAQADFRQPIGPRIEARQVPIYTDPSLRLPLRTPDLKENERDLTDLNTDINTDFEESLPFQKGIISETYQRLDRSYIKELLELVDLLDTTKIIQKFLPKQTDIDKIVDVIQRKVLKGTHLPLTIKEIQAAYLTSPYFKDLYLYLAQNKLPSKRSAIHKAEALAEKFILLDSLLFKLVTTPNRETVLLAVPETCADKIITLYHYSLFDGHQGVIKTYLTIGDKFFIPASCIT